MTTKRTSSNPSLSKELIMPLITAFDHEERSENVNPYDPDCHTMF